MDEKPEHAYPGVVVLLDWLQGLPRYRALVTHVATPPMLRFHNVIDGLRRAAAVRPKDAETLSVMRAGLWIACDLAKDDRQLAEFVLILEEAIAQLDEGADKAKA